MTVAAMAGRVSGRASSPADPTFGGVGHPHARLLAGPSEADGAETLDAHLERLGAVPVHRRAGELIEVLRLSGLEGRGGAGFPVADKVAAAIGAGGPCTVVVNASESEPASRKDRTLLRARPHLVLDGAALLAEATESSDVVVQTHRGDSESRAVLRAAIAEREHSGWDPVPVRLSVGPDRFVAGESSAVVAFLEGRPARPRPGPPAAVSGVHGRPTLVQNVETLAHVALIARFGPDWFRSAGGPGSPGSVLVTVAGDVARPGAVLEVWDPTPLGRIVTSCALPGDGTIDGSGPATGAAVLLGGYGGAWAPLADVWALPVDREALRRVGLPLGCGLVGVLSAHACGLRETARLLGYLAAESAGQCGPCALGLPELADRVRALAGSSSSRAAVRRMLQRTDAIVGRGACAHPDGAVHLLESALEVFADDVHRHLRRGSCAGARRPAAFPVPEPGQGWR